MANSRRADVQTVGDSARLRLGGRLCIHRRAVPRGNEWAVRVTKPWHDPRTQGSQSIIPPPGRARRWAPRTEGDVYNNKVLHPRPRLRIVFGRRLNRSTPCPASNPKPSNRERAFRFHGNARAIRGSCNQPARARQRTLASGRNRVDRK